MSPSKNTFNELVNDDSIVNIADNLKMHGRNTRSIVSGYGILFDSKEELDFYEWIIEAKSYGFIAKFEYQPASFSLFDGTKNTKDKFIIRPHVYTADFKIEFTDIWTRFRKENKIKIFDKFNEHIIYVDIKGGFSIYDDGRSFIINQKWVMSKYGTYIWKIIPLKFFELTWLPRKCVFTRKTNKISKRYSKLLTFDHKFPCLMAK